MAVQTTCDLCRVVLTNLANGERALANHRRPRLIALCPNPEATAESTEDTFELDLDVCKACLRQVVGTLRDCLGQKCSAEFIESSAKFLRDTAFDWESKKVES